MENKGIKKNYRKSGKAVVGFAFLAVGSLLLLKQFGFYYPRWIISWPMLLIILGIANAVKHNFKNPVWFFLILIGSIFLIEKIDPSISVSQYTWPIVIIAIGLYFIFGRNNADTCKKNRFKQRIRKDYSDNYTTYDAKSEEIDAEIIKDEDQPSKIFSSEDYIDTVAIFGETKKNVLSKNFKGGDAVTIMGGTTINLTHANINGKVMIEITNVFGGTKIIVPPTWDVSPEMAAIFGGVDDKRGFSSQPIDPDKMLIIKGTSVFGGVEIRNL